MARLFPLLLVVGAVSALACTIVYPVHQAGPSFRIAVAPAGSLPRPLRVTLIREGASPISAPVGDNGIASFRRVPNGDYQIHWDDGTGLEMQGGLNISSSRPTNQLYKLEPYQAPIRAVSLKGSLGLNAYPPGSTQPPFALALQRNGDGPVLLRSNTNASGAFEFPDLPAGLYLLSVHSPETGLRGRIKLNLDPRASFATLNLLLASTSCGLAALDLSECPPANLTIHPEATIHVTDTESAAIDNARITFSNADLQIQAPGFSPFRAHVTKSPTGPRQIHVGLGVFGTCSRSRLDP